MKYNYQKVDIPKEWNQSPKLNAIDNACLQILRQRSFKTVEEAEEFLFPSFTPTIQNTSLKDSDQAVMLLTQAILQKDHIEVYQDYDVDGICACVIAVENLRRFGADVDYYGNDRTVDGYGLCKNGIDVILQKRPDTKLILTVDNGIVANEGIDYANSKGLTVIVTDHHEPGSILPNAAAVVNPKRKDETYHFHDLCGAGVILKVMVALGKSLHSDLGKIALSADLAAFATVADIVPMLGENRAIVKEGLKLINDGTRPAFRVMASVTGEQRITAHGTLAFKYAPMVNAASRMGHDVRMVVEMFLSDDEKLLVENILELDRINEARKEETDREVTIAKELLGTNPVGTNIVIYNESFQEGIIGIVAGRLKSEFHRPVVVFAPSANGALKASARSIPQFNLKKNLDKMPEVMLGYGGHTMAAGLSIQENRFQEFCDRFTEITDQMLSDVDIEETTDIDIVMHTSELSEDLIYHLTALEPFGEGFREPVFGLNALVDNVFFMGSEKQHVKWIDSSSNVSIIMWNAAEAARGRKKYPQKFIGRPSLNEFRGTVSVQFIAER